MLRVKCPTFLSLFLDKVVKLIGGGSVISGCTRPPQSQSGAIFCHQNNHCVVFESAGQFFWGEITGRYEKYASDQAFGTLLANTSAYI